MTYQSVRATGERAPIAGHRATVSAIIVHPPARGIADETALDPIGSIMHVGRGDPICHDGDTAIASFRILSGCVRLSKTLSDGRRHVLDFLFPGDFFGISPPDAYDCTVDAISPSKPRGTSFGLVCRLQRAKPTGVSPSQAMNTA